MGSVARNRRSIRLIGYDYSNQGWYFVTICSEKREEIFGEIVGARRDSPKMRLNDNGRIVKKIWKSLPNHHGVKLDEFVIMPNHIHLIVQIQGASRRAPTLGWLIGMFKTECTKEINKLNRVLGWRRFQRNYYEHIIRNEKELNAIRQYIRDNPQNWQKDKDNPINI